MATVYLARDIRHNRRVALKVLRPDLGAVVGVERFLAEIQVTANLQHPNLLPLFDSGAAGELLYYVMPYVQGESLRARLDREKQLPVAPWHSSGASGWAGPVVSHDSSYDDWPTPRPANSMVRRAPPGRHLRAHQLPSA
jgi:serine/threonine protein kinase